MFLLIPCVGTYLVVRGIVYFEVEAEKIKYLSATIGVGKRFPFGSNNWECVKEVVEKECGNSDAEAPGIALYIRSWR